MSVGICARYWRKLKMALCSNICISFRLVSCFIHIRLSTKWLYRSNHNLSRFTAMRVFSVVLLKFRRVPPMYLNTKICTKQLILNFNRIYLGWIFTYLLCEKNNSSDYPVYNNNLFRWIRPRSYFLLIYSGYAICCWLVLYSYNYSLIGAIMSLCVSKRLCYV